MWIVGQAQADQKTLIARDKLDWSIGVQPVTGRLRAAERAAFASSFRSDQTERLASQHSVEQHSKAARILSGSRHVMRMLTPLVLLALFGSAPTEAQTQHQGHSISHCFRLAALVATSRTEVNGGHGSLDITLRDLRAVGAAASVELFRGTYGLEMGTTWLHLESDEVYRIRTGTGFHEGTDSDSGRFVNLHTSPVLHLKLSDSHDLLLGPLLGIGISETEALADGLSYGAQAVLDLGSRGSPYRFTAGVQVVVVQGGGEYEGDDIPLLLARVGLRIN